MLTLLIFTPLLPWLLLACCLDCPLVPQLKRRLQTNKFCSSVYELSWILTLCPHMIFVRWSSFILFL